MHVLMTRIIAGERDERKEKFPRTGLGELHEMQREASSNMPYTVTLFTFIAGAEIEALHKTSVYKFIFIFSSSPTMCILKYILPKQNPKTNYISTHKIF